MFDLNKYFTISNATNIYSKFVFFLLTINLILLSVCYPQNSEYKFDHLSIEHGLSHGSVYSIIQDDQGYMWFGTEDGLCKYDGYNFTIYRHEPGHPNSLSVSSFGKILQDKNGVMWLGTWGGGLNRFNPGSNTFTHFRHNPKNPNSISQDRIEFIIEDRTGLLWIGTEKNGLNKFDPTEQIFVRYRHEPSNSYSIRSNKINTIFEDSAGNIWIGTEEGLSKLTIENRESGKFIHYLHNPKDKNSLSSNRIRAISQDHDGLLWIGTRNGGLNRFNPETGDFKRYKHDTKNLNSISGNSITRIILDSFGSLWIGTYKNGLNKFDLKTQTFNHFKYNPNNKNSISHNRPEAIYEDRTGIMWIGTRGRGINKLDLKPNKFRNYTHNPLNPNSLSHPTVRTIFQKDNYIWIGTDGGGLTRFDRRKNTYYHFTNDPQDLNSIGGDRIWSVLIDKSGILWAGTYYGGLNKYLIKGKKHQFYKYQHDPQNPKSISNNKIHIIFQDHDGDIFVGTEDGLNQIISNPFLNQILFKHYKYNPNDTLSISHNYVSCIYQDNSGIIWIGTRDGLNYFNKETGQFLRIKHNPENSNSISNNNIQTIYESLSTPGIIWIGTEDGGLNKLVQIESTKSNKKHFQFINYTEIDGLPGNVIDGILEDDQGYIWLSTSRGLSKFNPKTETFRNYDISDGLESHSFIRNSCFKNKKGEMFFGSIAGMVSFFPDKVKDNTNIPPVVLTSFKIYNKEKKLDINQIDLSYLENYITLEFSALDYTNQLKNNYAYKLIGVDPDWIYCGSRRFANYANLSPGAYEFHVKGCNNDGIWNQEGVSIKIVIAPPYWQTWWFYTFSVLGIFIILISFYKYRTFRITKQNVALQNEIDERKKTELELNKAQNYINNILNSMPSIVIGVDTDVSITHWNKEAENITGISKDKATGQPLEIVLPHMQSEIKRIKNSITSRQLIKENSISDIMEGKSKFSDLTVYPLISNRTEGAVIRIDDVTERVRLEEMMIQSEKMLSVGGLAAGMAHEINNPLAGILQNAQVILNRLTKKMDKNDEVAKECNTTFETIQSFMEKRKIIEMLEAINITGKRASKIVENMLSFSRKSESKFSSHDIRKILDDTIELAASDYDLKKKYDFRKIKIIKKYDDVPLVNCERSNIQQVFLNVLRNGAQAMMGVENKKEDPCFTFRVKQEDDMVRIEIEDNGSGMDEETRRRAFEPFYTTKEVSDGTGLGLSVSYFIIMEQHKGKMLIVSNKGKSTKVIINLMLC